ncbi:AI-2E family transporter [Muricoccus radiodurans]|uniref:AI-2E family transporter n=1 Tax=Muricoccus radiodurans TaxID=2231721 RepID=UPI003CF4A706
MALPDRSPAAPGLVAAPVPSAGVANALICAAIIVAALYLGRDVLVPLVLAVLLAFVLAPVARVLQRLRLGRGLAVLAAVLTAFAVIGGIGVVIGAQLAELAADLPRYIQVIRAKVGALGDLGSLLGRAGGLLQGLGLEGPLAPEAPAGTPPGTPVIVAAPARPEAPVLTLLRSVVGPVLHPLATAGLVIFFTILVLLNREDLRDRLIRLAGARDLHRTMTAMNDAADRLSRLFLAQVALNAGLAVAVSAVLWAIGLPSPVLWGILVGLMRFVPFIGTPIALIPPVVLALGVDPGWTLAITTFAVILVTEAVMGQVFEPLLFGKRTGLSPLSIILSASFWALLWGPIGLLIATPLTVGLVVLGRHVPSFEFFDVILGNRPSLQPEETFYQRALDGDADGLVDQATILLAEEGGSLATYGDTVVLKGLALAQADWAREAMEPERLEVVRRQVATLMDDLADRPPPAVIGEPVPPGWAAPGAIVCVPGRGQLDDLAARLAAAALQHRGFGAEAETNAVLDAAHLGRLDPGRVRLCLLGLVEDGNSVAGARTFLRRLTRQLPGTHVIVGLWHAPPDSPMLTALRQEGPAEAIVTSLREAIALCDALMLRPEVPSAH